MLAVAVMVDRYADWSVSGAAMMAAYAERVTIAPGYGQVVAQAQHQVRVVWCRW